MVYDYPTIFTSPRYFLFRQDFFILLLTVTLSSSNTLVLLLCFSPVLNRCNFRCLFMTSFTGFYIFLDLYVCPSPMRLIFLFCWKLKINMAILASFILLVYPWKVILLFFISFSVIQYKSLVDHKRKIGLLAIISLGPNVFFKNVFLWRFQKKCGYFFCCM